MESLCKAIITAFVFLELSSDDVVDPDSAIATLEAIAAELQAASLEERAAFIRTCSQEATTGHWNSGNKHIAQFIAELPRSIGLLDEEA